MKTLKEATFELESTILEQALIEAKGNRTDAATLLGLSRQGLINKLKSHGYHVRAAGKCPACGRSFAADVDLSENQ